MAADLASFDLDATWKYVNVCHTGLEPRTSRAQAGLLLTRVSLALDRWSISPRRASRSAGS